MNKQKAHDVFDVLVREANAPESHRASFVAYFTDSDPEPKEFRFMGSLGMGGKCWLDTYRDPPVFVTCYLEEETAARRETIVRTNAALATLGWKS